MTPIRGTTLARRGPLNSWIPHSKTDPQGPELSVVVPCFDEEAVPAELHRRLTPICERIGTYEVVLVNDGSRDGSWNLMRQLADRDPHLAVINLSRNHGHQLALTAGLMFARGQRILIVDADLQYPPELLPEMIRLMDEGADVVYGQRRQREGETFFKMLTSRLFYRLLGRLTDVNIPADTGDFRLMNRRSLDILNFNARAVAIHPRHGELDRPEAGSARL
jgi:polyisoprenyl-phosphate glycosyltransferase